MSAMVAMIKVPLATEYVSDWIISQRFVSKKFTAMRLARVNGRAKPLYICDDNGEDMLFDTKRQAKTAIRMVEKAEKELAK